MLAELNSTNMTQINLHVATSWSDQEYASVTIPSPTGAFPGSWNTDGRVLTCLRESYAGRIGQVRHWWADAGVYDLMSRRSFRYLMSLCPFDIRNIKTRQVHARDLL